MFHACDGLYFERTGDGGVAVSRHVPVFGPLGHATGDTARIERITIDPGIWASVVASVSARGEDAERFERARRFHG